MSSLLLTPTTRRRIAGAVVALAPLLVVAQNARADSDGYYCTGTGYLAYQLRAALTPGVSGQHVLRIVRFGSDGIHVAGEVSLPDFQPHKLVCGDSQVRIGGWMGRPVEYVVDIVESPKIAYEVSDPGQAMVGSALANLGAWARAGTVRLMAADRNDTYRIATELVTEPGGGGLLHRITTVIERLNEDGEVVDSLELYRGTREESVD